MQPESGEILMSGRNVMMGYLNNTEKTAETVEDSKEGWLRYDQPLSNYNLERCLIVLRFNG